MKSLITFILGERAKGEKLAEPKKFPIRNVKDNEWQEWAMEFKFGSRYGHRGSFYQNNFRVTVA